MTDNSGPKPIVEDIDPKQIVEVDSEKAGYNGQHIDATQSATAK